MESRPRIQLTLSPLARLLEITGWVLFVIMWLITLYAFSKMPDEVPTHINFSGKVDSYGHKWSLIILPVIASVIYVLLTWMNQYPHIFNYPVEITEHNAGRQYAIATGMIRGLKLVILLVFSLVILLIYLTAIGAADGFGLWFLPLILALIFTPIIISIRKAMKNKH